MKKSSEARPFINRIFQSIALALCWVYCVGCARTPNDAQDRDANEGSLQWILELNKKTYQPGETVIIRAELNHRGARESFTVQSLASLSIDFFYGPLDIDSRYRIDPVVSSKESRESGVETIMLHTGEKTSRSFAFTKLTAKTGQYTIGAIYHAKAKSSEGNVFDQLIAAPIQYTVEGIRVVDRDSAGLILRQSAIEICKQALGEPVRQSYAILIENEAGYMDWWVMLEPARQPTGQKEPFKRAWFVNPYLALIRTSNAKPFDPSLDDRTQHYTIQKNGARSPD